MIDSYTIIKGTKPVFISIPHNGSDVPESIAQNMESNALSSVDTDWHLDRLYEFARDLGCSIIIPRYSRYVIDLNRPEDDENLYPGSDTTGLCPANQFDFSPIYREGLEPDASEVQKRVELYWRPYHQALKSELDRIKKEFGFAFLFEAHSIKSEVPRFFEGKLSDFNFGNNNGESSSVALLDLLKGFDSSPYSKVINGRFKGGYITRAYGQPSENIESLQLELSQATYMDESTLQYDQNKANLVIPTLKSMLEMILEYSHTQASEMNASS